MIYLSKGTHTDRIPLVISHDIYQPQHWMWWRKVGGLFSPVFATSVTLHEDTLLWRIQCIFLRHGFLSIKEVDLTALAVSWILTKGSQTHLFYSVLLLYFMQLQYFIVRKEWLLQKHANWMDWTCLERWVEHLRVVFIWSRYRPQ